MKNQEQLTRSRGYVLDPDLVFPSLSQFNPPTQLPSIGSVISVLKFYRKIKYSNGSQPNKIVIKEVSKQIHAKYYHAKVYCVSLRTIERKVESLWKNYCEGVKRLKTKGMERSKAVKVYKELVLFKDRLFDVSAKTAFRKKDL